MYTNTRELLNGLQIAITEISTFQQKRPKCQRGKEQALIGQIIKEKYIKAKPATNHKMGKNKGPQWSNLMVKKITIHGEKSYKVDKYLSFLSHKKVKIIYSNMNFFKPSLIFSQIP